MYGRTRFSAWVVVAALLAACGPTPEQKQQLADLPVVSAEKDRLQAEVDRLSAEMSEIYTELARVPEAGAPTAEGAASASAPTAVNNLVVHVAEMEEQLEAAQTRLSSVNATTAAQRQRITELQAAIDAERLAIDGHRQTILRLESSVARMEAEVTRQAEENDQLEQAIEGMTDDANTVWYVVGTKEELLERGVISEEGGSRVLFIFGKRGKTIVPSRVMDTSVFTAADQRTLSRIPLPVAEEEAKWTVVTPQNLAAVSSPLDENGRVLGDALSITDPQRFWANGRYLIVVQS